MHSPHVGSLNVTSRQSMNVVATMEQEPGMQDSTKWMLHVLSRFAAPQQQNRLHTKATRAGPCKHLKACALLATASRLAFATATRLLLRPACYCSLLATASRLLRHWSCWL